MRTYRITTLGCKVNQCESDALSQALKTSGWEPAGETDPPRLHIINTCAVTGKADMQSRQAIRRAIRLSPGAYIVVTGCYAQVESDEIKKIPGVHSVIGHADKTRIPGLVAPLLRDKPAHPQTISGDYRGASDFASYPPPIPDARTRPFLKIQDGCNAFCAFCIVPHARGRSRSMPPDDVLEHIAGLKRMGYREIVVSGIHLGSYGLDLSPKTDLYSLLTRIDEARAMDQAKGQAKNRIRLSSIEPNELTDGIIGLVAKSGTFCRHFHIPLQSGDDFILNRMHRPYTSGYFKSLIHRIHDAMPDAAIGIDTLIGFPGESGVAFENTYRLVAELPVTYLHVFPFSARKQTPAHAYPEKLPALVIKERCRRMRALGDLKKAAFYKRFIGKEVDVLVESKRDPETGRLKGFTSNLIPVLIEGGEALKNTVVTAEIDALNGVKPVSGTICQARSTTPSPFPEEAF